MSIPGSPPEGQDQPPYYGTQPPPSPPQSYAPPAVQVWPPPPGQGAPGTWPPPAYGMQAPPQFIVPFKILFKRLEGSVPGYRTGTVSITADGIVIAGKTVMPYEKQAPILIASLPLRMYLVAYLVMEYGMRRDAYDMIPWTNVVRVASDPKRREICIMYDAPNHKGIVKRFSLTFKVDPTMFEPLIAAFGANGVDVQPAKLRPWSSPPALIFLIGVLIIILVIAGIALTSPSKPGP